MVPIDLSGKIALVTGVGDNQSFAWSIAKALQAAGARLLFSVHPRFMTIVQGFLDGQRDAESRVLPFGAGELKVEKLIPCDVSYDTMADAPDEVRNDRRFNRNGDFAIADMIQAVKAHAGAVDVLIHSVAFSRDIKKSQLETSRAAYLEALSISAFSLTALLRAAAPLMEGRPGGAAALGLTYMGGDRVVPHYGGGMSACKAALQIDAMQLAKFLGPKNIRVNLISAGPYASRAASNIGDIQKMIDYNASRSPLPRGIEAEEVANAALFLCSPLASAITGEVLYVDCGYNVMGV
jgi:enoyl-[acyl-carrier protein] reductase I